MVSEHTGLYAICKNISNQKHMDRQNNNDIINLSNPLQTEETMSFWKPGETTPEAILSWRLYPWKKGLDFSACSDLVGISILWKKFTLPPILMEGTDGSLQE